MPPMAPAASAARMAVVTGSIKVSFPVSFARGWEEDPVPPVLSLKNGAVATVSDEMVLDTKNAARESQETNVYEIAQWFLIHSRARAVCYLCVPSLSKISGI